MTKTWFITGVSSGFGRLMCEQLLGRGDRVAGTVRDRDSTSDLEKQYADHFRVWTLDVTDVKGIQRVVSEAFTTLGRIDVVVNNAGYGLFGAIEGLSEAQIEHALDTNLLGSIHVIRSAIPFLRTQGGGRILQLSTVGGQWASAGGSMYHASKWGIEGFMDAMRVELAPFKIDCTIIEPGSAHTGFRSGARLGQRLPVYEGTPASRVHVMLQDQKTQSTGKADVMVKKMIHSVEASPAPHRVVLGSDCWKLVTGALKERLADIEPQQASAAESD